MRQADIRTKPKRRGNYVPGKGRPRGSKNRSTLELEAAMVAAEDRLRSLTPELESIDAHGLLTVVYRDAQNPIFLRVQAAQAAIRYEKPALSSAQIDATVSLRLGIAQELVAANQRLSAAARAESGSLGSAKGPHLGDSAAQSALVAAFASPTT